MRSIKHLLLLLIYLISPLTLSGEPPQLTFNKLTNKNGLSHNRINKIYQDSYGIMWFGTLQGLNRYDGLRVSNFDSPLTKCDNPISNQLILTIFENQDSAITITNLTGEAAVYDRQSGKLIRAKTQLPKSLINSSIYARNKVEDSEKNSWFAFYGGGVVKVDNKNKKTTNYFKSTQIKSSLSSNMVYALQADGDYIWVGTDNGLDRINIVTNQIEHYRNEINNENSLPSNSILAIHKDRKGILWLATSFGLCRFDTRNNRFKNYYHNRSVTNSICDNYITSIAEDLQGRIWIGTQNGLSVIEKNDSQNEIISSYYTDNSNPNSLSSNNITTLYIDNSNLLWVGTFNSGINIASLKESHFKHYKQNADKSFKISQDVVRALYEDREEKIWVGGLGGEINIIDRENEIIESFNIFKTAVPDQNNQIRAFSQDNEGNMWIGTSNSGLRKILYSDLYLKDKKTQSYSHIHTDSTSIISNTIQDIFTDKDGRIWVGTEHGLSLYNPILDSFKSIGDDFRSSNQLSDKRVQSNAIFQDSNGSIWIGTWNGLNKLLENNSNRPQVIDEIEVPPHSFRFKSYYYSPKNNNTLSDNRITSINEDSKKNLFISTYGNGVNIFNESLQKFTHIKEKDGLSNDIVYTIIEDDQKNIWFSTNYGLSKYVTANKQFRNYDEKDGIQSNFFYWGSGIKCKDGSLAFGGTNGLNIFDPTDLVDDLYVPIVNFSDLQINNKSTIPGAEDGILSVPIWNTKEITLPYSKDFIKINFTSLNYINPEKIRYNYILEGFDNEWVTVSNLNSVTYSNLKPKRYIFRVRASNSDGIWGKKYTELIINITPPYYSTLWFKTTLTILLLGLIILIVYIKVKSIKNLRVLLEKRIEARSIELSAINTNLNEIYNELRETNVLLQESYEETTLQKEAIFDQHDEIVLKNKELEHHKANLEEIVYKRTKELVDAKNLAEEAERLKSSFIANMSHEIRTPLNAIVGFSNLITIPDNTALEKVEYSLQIATNTEQLLLLVEDILELSTLEAKQLTLELELLNVKIFLEKIHKYWNGRFSKPDREIILNYGITETDFTITTDVKKTRKILEKFLSNACKYCPIGTIEIGVERKRSELIFYVKDSGIGIPEALQIDIFQAYKKNFKYKGSGLGLAIASKMAEILKAKLSVHSKEGEGATFFLTLNLD